jgi:hypothetical protein
MAIREILIKKLEYQIFAWQKEMEKVRSAPPRKPETAPEEAAIARFEQDPAEYVERLERNLAAAHRKIEEVRQADEDRLLVLKRQLHDWMD